jgi:hypothetical protein
MISNVCKTTILFYDTVPSDTAINIAADISLKLNCPVFFEWQAKSEDGYIDTQIRVESMGLQKQND